jgi:hypothetical protein
MYAITACALQEPLVDLEDVHVLLFFAESVTVGRAPRGDRCRDVDGACGLGEE